MLPDVGIADHQKAGKQGRNNSIKQFSIQPRHHTQSPVESAMCVCLADQSKAQLDENCWRNTTRSLPIQLWHLHKKFL